MPGPVKRNRTAIDQTVAALRADGRIQPADEAIVTIARQLAVACDKDPHNASLWREYRRAVATLQEVTADDGDGGAAERFAAAVRAPVGDPPQY